MTFLRSSISIAAAVFASTLSAKADFRVCNRTPDSVSVASAWVSPSGGFTSQGWWSFAPAGDAKQWF